MDKNKFIIFLTLLLLNLNFAFAFDLDLTVDDEIRKNYNPSKLVKDTNTDELEELPPLPSMPKVKSNSNEHAKISQPQIMPNYTTKYGNIKIHKGTVFDVVNTSKISDWQTKGTAVQFKTKTPIIKNKYTIPTNTIFYGEITESHQPQITCNGGLVVIRIRSMRYKGEIIPINAYVINANAKHVFLNNIKGNRTYLKTTWKKGNWGRALFGRMTNLTVKLGGDGSTLLLSPFPFAYGTICLGLNTLTSPICAFFSKGSHVSIPAGSSFKIRLLDTAYVD